jgi:hypothetical protein
MDRQKDQEWIDKKVYDGMGYLRTNLGIISLITDKVKPNLHRFFNVSLNNVT